MIIHTPAKKASVVIDLQTTRRRRESLPRIPPGQSQASPRPPHSPLPLSLGHGLRTSPNRSCCALGIFPRGGLRSRGGRWGRHLCVTSGHCRGVRNHDPVPIGLSVAITPIFLVHELLGGFLSLPLLDRLAPPLRPLPHVCSMAYVAPAARNGCKKRVRRGRAEGRGRVRHAQENSHHKVGTGLTLYVPLQLRDEVAKLEVLQSASGSKGTGRWRNREGSPSAHCSVAIALRPPPRKLGTNSPITSSTLMVCRLFSRHMSFAVALIKCMKTRQASLSAVRASLLRWMSEPPTPLSSVIFCFTILRTFERGRSESVFMVGNNDASFTSPKKRTCGGLWFLYVWWWWWW